MEEYSLQEESELPQEDFFFSNKTFENYISKTDQPNPKSRKIIAEPSIPKAIHPCWNLSDQVEYKESEESGE